MAYKSENIERIRALSQLIQDPTVYSFCENIVDRVEKIKLILNQPRVNKKTIKAELDSLLVEIKKKHSI